MSNNEWVQEGTPREADEWAMVQDDYGVPVPPAEWDDNSAEQRKPVPATPDHDDVAEADAPDGLAEGGSAGAAGYDPVASEDVEVVSDPGEEQPVEAAVPEPGEGQLVEGVEAALPEAAEAEDEATESFLDAVEPASDEVASSELTATRPRPREVETFGRPAEDGDGGEAVASTSSPADDMAATTAMADLYREDADQTQVIDTEGALAAEVAEEARLAEQLRLEKEARDQRLGMVATSDANAWREPPRPRPGVGGFGSFGLLILRLVTAGILVVAAVQVLSAIDGTADYLSATVLPDPREIAWGLGITLAVLAAMLILGLGVRAAGFLLAALGVCALVFLRWGPFPIFVEGTEGFIGDKDLILTAIGILFLSIGGGKAGIDASISKARWEANLAKQS
ncbi:Uncharacterized membrane protein YphA, DoxX/SURF4 family [Tessaracoccus bendigoensis DSM 12906]|uniref:Uncharacterized membrane protein YphA, DoxX/SURF4 family n=1 Tax=Tessaracoccus bendigoensis DSM 12906 TaxID=1123357 RepID=A0A1M6H5S3_9ACTN|nr:DoxX family protein [Tessaracoccus bendigoensis]SHJ17523.1 Uncharacterized membrane protein YphA, DoxX/SURF4 family [Tessaracoccus bendigoensis DSM 12906]